MDFGDMLNEAREGKKKPWMDQKKFILGTVENLPSIIDACIASGRYACDLETSGVDNRVYTLPSGNQGTYDQIAGVGLCADGETGYYIPLRHSKVKMDGTRVPYECNVPIQAFAEEFLRLTEATDTGKTIAVFHNGKFDQEFLQFNGTGVPWGEWEKPSSWDDTMILCYLRNARARNKRLKDLAATPRDIPKEAWANTPCGGPGIGMEMIHLYEVFGHDKEDANFSYDFTTLDPSDETTLYYACGDVICTWLLYPVLAPPVLDPDSDGGTQKAIYTVEKGAVTACRWMERNRIHVNMDRIKELIILGHKEWFASIMEVYETASRILGRDVMPGIYKVLQDIFVDDDTLNLIPDQLNVAERRAKGVYADKGATIIGRENKKWPAVYDVNAPMQLGVMFDEMEVPNLKHTEKSGQVKTSKDELDRVIEEAGEQFPFMNKIKRFREVNKALSTYLYPMIWDVDTTGGIDPNGGLMRIAFNGHKVDTGRYATSAKDGGRSRLRGWPLINFQAIPSTAFDPKNPRPECMRRIREVVTARPTEAGQPPKYIAAIDFSGEELRLVTNLSREPKWLTEFFRCSGCGRTFSQQPRPQLEGFAATATPAPPPHRCPNCASDKIGDLHTLTAMEVYGADAPNRPEWKVLRGHAKGVNFGLCYGGGGQAVCRATGCEKNEGWRIKNTFDKTYSGLRAWWDKTHAFARKHGFVRTAFGRKYPLPDINSQDGFFKSKAERNAVNGPIQGSGADICKIAMTLIHKEMKKRGWLDKCMMVASMHDELVFEIDADILEEVLPLLVNIMASNNAILGKNWIIPLTCDVEIGPDWTVAWDINGMTYKEVRFLGNKKIKDPSKCPEGVDFDSLPSWPEELTKWFYAARGEQPATPLATVAMQPSDHPTMVVETISVKEPPAEPFALGTMQRVQQVDSPATNGANWEYHLTVPLTADSASKLAAAILACRGTGMTPLKVKTRDGVFLDFDSQLSAMGIKGPILVSHRDFDAAAKMRKL